MVCLKKHGIIARPKHKPQKKCTYEGCEYAAYKDQNLKNHINRVHLKIALDKDYACENCGEKFNSKDTLKHHNIQHHSGRRDYKCDQCGAAFAHSQLLNKHMDIHSDIRKYVCANYKVFDSRHHYMPLFYTYQRFFVGLVVFYRKLLGRA